MSGFPCEIWILYDSLLKSPFPSVKLCNIWPHRLIMPILSPLDSLLAIDCQLNQRLVNNESNFVTNCPGAKLSWCQIVLVPNCLVLYCHGAKLLWCQIVLVTNCPGAKLSGAILPWCQIDLVPNCPVPNCPVAKLYGAKFPLYHLWLAKWIFSTYLASQDALEVMRVTE